MPATSFVTFRKPKGPTTRKIFSYFLTVYIQLDMAQMMAELTPGETIEIHQAYIGHTLPAQWIQGMYVIRWDIFRWCVRDVNVHAH